MNYYPFHIGDYLSATRHLSWEEDSAYRRLLDTYYTTEKPLPKDLKQVCRLVLATTQSQREAVQTVLDEFFEATDEGWVNQRADSEIEAMREKQQKQRDRANKRWQKQAQKPGNASAMPRHASVDAVASKTDTNALPPTPTPTPTPIDSSSLRSEESATKSPRAPRPKKEDCTLSTYLAICRACGQKPIPAEHPIRAYCADAGISDEMLQVAWITFRDDHMSGEKAKKRYRDWPATFANSVRDRWYKLWFSESGEGDSRVGWTSNGLQAKRVIEARMAAKEAQHESA